MGGGRFGADAAEDRSGRARNEAAQSGPTAAGVLVGVGDVGNDGVVGRLDLAGADVGAALQVAVGAEAAFGVAHGQASAAVHHLQAVRALGVELDQGLRAAEVVAEPPLVLG